MSTAGPIFKASSIYPRLSRKCWTSSSDCIASLSLRFVSFGVGRLLSISSSLSGLSFRYNYTPVQAALGNQLPSNHCLPPYILEDHHSSIHPA